MLKGLKSAIKWIIAIVLICVVAVFLASINGLNVTRTVITVNGSEITEDEYKFYVEMEKITLLNEQGITDEETAKEFLKNGKIGEKSAADYIKEKALNKVTKFEYAIVKAKEAGLFLTDEEKESARSTDGMEEQIKAYGVSERIYADVMEKSSLVNKYYSHLLTTNPEAFQIDDADVKKNIDKSYALVQHVLIMNAPQDGTEADENYAKDAKKKAEEVLAKAVSGADFSKLIAEYNEDPGMTNSPDGYLITEQGYTLDGQSQMVTEFTNGAFAVKPNEVNPELVESTYGWHIIKRCAMAETNENYETVASSARNTLSSEKFDAYLETLLPSADIVKKDNILNKIKVKF